MKPQEIKERFIELRAEGYSYDKIKKELGISKDTCHKWEQTFKEQIEALKGEALNNLYKSYSMTKEARIRKLGDTLEDIDKALDNVDLSEVTPSKLLEYKLKYSEALRKEYTPIAPPIEEINEDTILSAFADLLNRARAGEATTEQAMRESTVLATLLKAYETVELKTKVEELEAIIGSRA